MQAKEPRKLFSVERRARERQAQQAVQPDIPVDLILEEIRALRAEVAELRTSGVTVAATSEAESTTAAAPPHRACAGFGSRSGYPGRDRANGSEHRSGEI